MHSRWTEIWLLNILASWKSVIAFTSLQIIGHFYSSVSSLWKFPLQGLSCDTDTEMILAVVLPVTLKCVLTLLCMGEVAA